MKLLTVTDIQKMVRLVGIDAFLDRLITALEVDFARWNEFLLSPRHATHYSHGVIELMPCSDSRLYSFKYVSGHPENAREGKLSIIAIGQLSEVSSGYPLLISEMTLLTAFRTAAVGVLAARYLARKESRSLAIIGTGAQSEFQVIGFQRLFDLKEVRFFDSDSRAMEKFEVNLRDQPFRLIPCANVAEAIAGAELIVTATAYKGHQTLFSADEVAPGTHIQAIGGDCPGKTELDPDLLKRAKIVVEYKPQSLIEGEMQECDPDLAYADLWELVCNNKPGRENDQEITIFDSVGFALEDFSALRVVYELAEEYQLGSDVLLIPESEDPKNLFGLVSP